jgi:hypothetical protein
MLAYGGNERRRRATGLAEAWGRISTQHLSGGQGCGCSFGGLMLQASDFEVDIVEFVIGEARQAGLRGVESYIDEISKRGPDRYSLPALLKAIAAGEHRAASEAEIDFTLARLDQTLGAIEQAHSARRFACD